MGRLLISVEEKLRGDTDKRLSGEIREISKIRTNSKSIKSKNWWKSAMRWIRWQLQWLLGALAQPFFPPLELSWREGQELCSKSPVDCILWTLSAPPSVFHYRHLSHHVGWANNPSSFSHGGSFRHVFLFCKEPNSFNTLYHAGVGKKNCSPQQNWCKCQLWFENSPFIGKLNFSLISSSWVAKGSRIIIYKNNKIMSRSDCVCFPACSATKQVGFPGLCFANKPPPLSVGIFQHWKPHCALLASNLKAELWAPCRLSTHCSLAFSFLLGCPHLIWMSPLFPQL